MNKSIIRVVAAIIFNDKNQVLITQRPAGSHLGGMWEFPGGTIEFDEKPEAALARELREELLIGADTGALIHREIFEYDIKIIDIAFYACRLKDKNQQPVAREVADFRWVALPDLDQYPFPPADDELIAILKQKYSGI